jgi:hypothetical protein
MFVKTIVDWLSKDRSKDRPATRGMIPCHKCKLKINYGFDKSGSFINCPRCRVSVRLPAQPTTLRCESESGYDYQTVN